MCPYGLIYNILHALPWPAIVGTFQPWLQALKLRRKAKKSA